MQEFDRFMEVVRTIREKCPWDSVQTHESLKKYLVEESQEVLDGIDQPESVVVNLLRNGEKIDSVRNCHAAADIIIEHEYLSGIGG